VTRSAAKASRGANFKIAQGATVTHEAAAGSSLGQTFRLHCFLHSRACRHALHKGADVRVT
jgi:hypothetical protein